jgi:hypothetical protein
VVEDVLPESVGLVAVDSRSGVDCDVTSNDATGLTTVTCTLGILEADTTERIEIMVTPREAGVIVNTASVVAVGAPPDVVVESTQVLAPEENATGSTSSPGPTVNTSADLEAVQAELEQEGESGDIEQSFAID